ncbi:MAG: hypothetical protein ACE5D3_09010 [Candidatus Binatia bacterium]
MNNNLGTNQPRPLEEEYSRREDARRLAKLGTANPPYDPLGSALDATDPVVAKHLLELGISSEVIPALRLFPLFAVAWSDGRLDQPEVDELLAEAEAAGITEQSSAHELIKNWIRNKPDGDFEESWKIYARSLRAKIGGRATNAIRDSVLRRARTVAEASGGLLGFGAVSRCEQRTLDALGDAFAEPSVSTPKHRDA